MKRNNLTTSVVAGLAAVAGFASTANAVELNPDGTGQVLVYPYYTVNKNQQTLISVVNTTNIAKAVKVRFLEGHNSREVLDFNLFLSEFDVWTASVFALSDAGLTGRRCCRHHDRQELYGSEQGHLDRHARHRPSVPGVPAVRLHRRER